MYLQKCLSHEPGQIEGNSTLRDAWSHLAWSELGLNLAGIEVLVTLKKQREIRLLEQHYSIACPSWGFIRHRCCAPAGRRYV